MKLNILTDMRSFPSISILIPAHNEEKVIEHTLKAILSLDYPHDMYEILVINDGSTDCTGQIIEDIKNNISRPSALSYSNIKR